MIEIAGGIILAFVVMGLLDDYPILVNLLWVIIGVLGVWLIWPWLSEKLIILVCFIILYVGAIYIYRLLNKNKSK